jgi:hypothetical protein
MLTATLLSVLLAGGSLAPSSPDTALPHHLTRPGIVIEYADADSGIVSGLAATLTAGRAAVQDFFGAPFGRPITIRVYPDRASLTAHWAASWGVPDLKAECWMVASGVAGELALLSPRVWPTEACEHDPADTASTRRVLWHELVHVYHGQHNPHPTFDGMDDLGWFVEGLAVVASGQLGVEHREDARQAIAAGAAPSTLAKAWSGRWRYGVSGSLVEYVDRTWGRGTVTAMLADTTQAGLLARLSVTEEQFLERWRAAVGR